VISKCKLVMTSTTEVGEKKMAEVHGEVVLYGSLQGRVWRKYSSVGEFEFSRSLWG